MPSSGVLEDSDPGASARMLPAYLMFISSAMRSALLHCLEQTTLLTLVVDALNHLAWLISVLKRGRSKAMHSGSLNYLTPKSLEMHFTRLNTSSVSNWGHSDLGMSGTENAWGTVKLPARICRKPHRHTAHEASQSTETVRSPTNLGP